jgi:hypothetical protein
MALHVPARFVCADLNINSSCKKEIKGCLSRELNLDTIGHIGHMPDRVDIYINTQELGGDMKCHVKINQFIIYPSD